MTAATVHHPSHREILGELFERLARLHAAVDSLRLLADLHATTSATLTDALHSLERDLVLASGAAGQAASQITPRSSP
jgi:hypothetical protein